jgi:Tol biopolymer transport system component
MTGTGGSASLEWNSIYPIDMTPDGRYIVFTSNASNLGAVSVGRSQAATQLLIDAASPTNSDNSQIYRFDTQTGEMLLVTDTFGFFDPDGTGTDPGSDILRLPNDICSWPSISADGRYVAFQSRSEIIGEPIVLDEDFLGVYNIFVRDLNVAVTDAASDAAAYMLISDLRFSDGTSSDFLGLIESIMPTISDDGNRIAFTSRDDVLEDDLANDLEEYDIYIWERDTDTIRLVSNQGGNFFDNTTLPGVPNSDRYGMSPNGEFIIFQSAAPLTNDDPDFATDTNFRDMFIWTADTGAVSYFNLGGDLDGFRWASVRNEPMISNDGNLAIFWYQGRFDPAKTDNQYSLYGVNRAENTITLLSRNAQGENANLDAIAFQDTGTPQFSHPSIANALVQEDAIGVVFDLQASNLVPNDENGHRDVFYITVSTVPTSEPIPGDINGDELVNTADVTFLGNVVAGLETLPEGVNGDIDGDEDVDMDDVTELASQIVNP